jgi:hypothetical protein
MTTLERLQAEYQEADLHPRHAELVKEEEIFFLLDHTRWYWPYVYLIVFIGAIILSGVIGR